MTTFFQKLFSNNRENNKSHKSNAPQSRRLRIESLESRELLAVSPVEFNAIRSAYPDLNLAANMSSYNVIEIKADELTDYDLRTALTQAGNTTANDLIVVRTTETQNRIMLGGTELAINITTSSRGTVAIVSLGDVPLTIDANQNTRVFNIGSNSNVALAGITITGGNVTGTNNGGAILSSGILTITDCTISGNTAASGGGIYAGSGTLTVTSSTISGNGASNGGGICGYGTVINSVISGNSASANGGGIFGTLTVTSSTISGNRASNGGGIYGYGTVINSVISGNSASANGGGFFTNGTSSITNSTIAGNRATNFGSGIYVAGGRTTLNNTIVAKNTDDSFEVHCNTGTVVGSYNLIGSASSTSLINGVNGNIIGTLAEPIDPKFVSPPIPATWTSELWRGWDLRLAADSPAIDTGRNEFAVASGTTLRYDLDGSPRIVGGVVDIGAYERGSVGVSATIPANFRSTGKTSNSIILTWDAVSNATGYEIQYRKSGETAWTSVTVSQTSRTVTGLDTDTIYEFQICASNTGGTFDWSQTLSVKTGTTISSTEFNAIRAVYPDLNLSANMANYSIIVITADQLVEEIYIRNAIAVNKSLIVCRTTSTQNKITLAGSELAINGSVAIVSLGDISLTIDANQTSGTLNVTSASSNLALGGLTITGSNTSGAILSSGILTITNNTISGNSGSGIYATGSASVAITNNTISGNSGSGIYATGSASVAITNNIISGNSGSGIYDTSSASVTITNNIISGNSSSGISTVGKTTITNSTISGNGNTSSRGGGINVSSDTSDSTTTVTNCIISENSALEGGGIHIGEFANVIITNSIISGNTASNKGGGINARNARIVQIMGRTISINVMITNSTISENTATEGGGIYFVKGTDDHILSLTATVANSIISGNRATSCGGIYTGHSTSVNNSVISGNYGEGIYASSGILAVTNCTITGSSTHGIVIVGGATTINNSIVAENASNDVSRNTGTLTGNNNLIGNGSGQTIFVNGANGNIVGTAENPIDPHFIDVSTDNYRLDPSSPAIDKGRNALAVDASGNPLQWDLDGKPRIYNGTVDMGAYEYNGVTIVVPATPINFRSTAKTTNSVTLAWNSVSSATGYEIQYRRVGTTTWTPISVSGTTRTVSSLTDNTAYEFQVCASNANGNSAWSESVFVTTDALIVTDDPTHRLFASNNGNEINTINVAASGTFKFDVRHELLNLENPIDCFGIGIKITYNSEYLDYIGYTNYLSVGKVGVPSDSTPPGMLTMAWNQLDQDWLRDIKDSLGTISVFTLIAGLQFKVKDGVGKNDDIFITLDFTSYDEYAGFQVAPPHNIKVNIVTASLDITGSGKVDMYDANLLLRHAFNYTGAALVQGIPGKTPQEVLEYITTNTTVFDINGDGKTDMYDANLLLRYSFSYTGAALTQGIPGRSTQEVLNHIQSFSPSSASSAMAAPMALADVVALSSEEENVPTHRLFAALDGTETDTMTVKPGEEFSFDVRHELLNLENPIDCFGIGIKVTYNTEYLEYLGYTDVLRVDRVGFPSDSTPPGMITMAWNQMDQDWLRDVKDSLGTISVFNLIKGLQFKVKDDVEIGTDDIFVTLDFTSYDYNAGFEIAPPQTIRISTGEQKTALTSVTSSTDSPVVGTQITTTLMPDDATATYQWYRGSVMDNVTISIEEATSSSYTPTVADIGHFLRVEATGTGSYTGTVEHTLTNVVPKMELTVPTLGEVIALSSSEINVTWDVVSNASGYLIQYTTNAAFTEGIETVTVNSQLTISTEIADLTANTLYYVRIMATGTEAYSNSDYSEAKSTMTFPSAPVNFVSTEQTVNSVTLSWTAQDNLTGYVLEYKKSADSTWTTWTPAPGIAATSATITGLDANTAYLFQLTAINASGSASSETTATTAQVGPENPLVITTLDDGGVSLYNAISNAKDGDTIIFDTGLSGTVTLSGGELIIDKSIKIDANGADITIDADGQSRVFSIASGTTVTLVGLTITGGNTTGNGGGILNAGILTLEDCTITGNTAKRGGGIASTGTTIIIGGTISGNTSNSYGGGVYIQRGTTTITDCIITGNKMEPIKLSGGAVLGGSGGGIYNAGTLFVTGGEITNNTAHLFAGGGISNEGKATIEGCTVSGNEAEWGGGVSNSNYGTMTITDSTIEKNEAKQGYGGIGNAGNLTLYDTIVTENMARKLGGGLGNNTGKVALHGATKITGNTSNDEYKDIWTKPEDAVTWHNTQVSPASLSFAPVVPVYEISTPTNDELFSKTLTYWEFSATAISSSPIKDWEINWGDGSENTLILGGPRSRINVTHYFREAGTYTITIKTIDFDGVVNTITIGTYTVKERVIEYPAVESFASIEPELDLPELSLQEPVVVSFAAPVQFTEASRFTDNYLSDLMGIMRQRQMLDLDQSGQKSEGVPFAELIWSDDDLFDTDWIGLSEQPEESNFWDGIFENDLLVLK